MPLREMIFDDNHSAGTFIVDGHFSLVTKVAKVDMTISSWHYCWCRLKLFRQKE